MNYEGNMPSGPVGASLGGLTPQAAQIQEVMAMSGNLNEGQLQTVQQHVQDRFVTMQQRRGVPEVFGDGLGFFSVQRLHGFRQVVQHVQLHVANYFFPSNAFMASARSFNTFNCMLQIRLQMLISVYKRPSAD